MFEMIRGIWNSWAREGIDLPYARDYGSNKPSLTLLMFYLTFVLAICSLIALHLNSQLLSATSMCLLAWGMGFVFYRLRHLDKVKIDLDDKSIALEDTPDKEPEEGEKGD